MQTFAQKMLIPGVGYIESCIAALFFCKYKMLMKRLSSIPVLLLIPFFCLGQLSAPETIRLTDSAACTIVKDQGMSPTCWVFGTNSLFESDLIKQYDLRLNLSEMFIARHAYIDKAEKYLESGGKTYFAGGGQFRDVLRVVNRHGMMTEAAYSGNLNNNSGHDHAALDTTMKYHLNDWLKQGKRKLSEADVRQLNDTLDKYLGSVPPAFLFGGKIYSSKTFAHEVARFGDDYVELMSFAGLPYYERSLFDDKFNWAGDSLYNVPLNDLLMLVDTALANGWSVGWEGDVTEKEFNHFGGYAALGEMNGNTDSKRLQEFKAGTTERDHMLHLVGIGRDDSGKKWYYLKNSWGTWLGRHKGYIYMDESYFKLKTLILMVNKKSLPESLRQKLKIK